MLLPSIAGQAVPVDAALELVEELAGELVEVDEELAEELVAAEDD